MQDVDGLKPSQYLIQTAEKNIKGEIFLDYAEQLITGYYKTKPNKDINTRTTAVFFIKYLKTLGFDVTNDIFADNAWYFRNALVRANYNDLTLGVYETTKYLELFIKNLLLKETNTLKNRTMHINYRKSIWSR